MSDFWSDTSSTSVLYVYKQWRLWHGCTGSPAPSLVAMWYHNHLSNDIVHWWETSFSGTYLLCKSQVDWLVQNGCQNWNRMSKVACDVFRFFMQSEQAYMRLVYTNDRYYDTCFSMVVVVHVLSHVIRKPVYAVCEQWRCRSACASMQCNQRLCCLLPRYM